MTKKQEQEAQTALEQLDKLTQDILKNATDGGDVNFRQLVFSGLTQNQNPILLEKMKELLFTDTEEDLKKTIILGIFIHKEMFEPVIEYGEKVINMPYIDESYDEKESFLFILDALMELAYKEKINEFESAIPMFLQLYKISCSAKSSSILADKLLQRLLNSKIGTIKTMQKEFADLIQDDSNEINSRVIAIDILARGKYDNILNIIENLISDITNDNLIESLPLLDVSTLALSYYQDKKYLPKIRRIIEGVKKLELEKITTENDLVTRIVNRIKKFQNNINSKN